MASAIGPIFRNELRMLLRDRRTIMMSVILPLAVMPIMLYASRWTEQKREKKLAATVYTYAVGGSQAAAARELLAATEAALAAEPDQAARLRIAEKRVADPEKALEAGDLHVIVEGVTGAEAEAAAKAAASEAERSEDEQRAEGEAEREPESGLDAREKPVAGDALVVRLVYRGDRDESGEGARRIRDALAELRTDRRAALLAEQGFAVKPQDVAAVAGVSVATKGQVAGLTLGRMLTLFLLLFILSGGSVVATDSLAGEKERGTLETILTTAASRVEIIVAKQLAILAVALLITVIQVANLLAYVGFKLIPAPEGFAAAVPPPVALLLFVLYLPVVALLSGVLLVTSGYAKTYKEAQLNFFPIFMLSMIPALAPFLPGVGLRSAIVAVPVANIAVAVKEILIGVFDWPLIAVAWLVTAAAAVLTGRMAVNALSTERLISPSVGDAAELRGGPALFPRRVLRWFAVMWAVLLAVSANAEATMDIRLQLVVNLVVLFGGATLLMVRRYRLDPVEALALRPVKPVVWLAVLVGAPAGLVSALGVMKLATLILPVPPEVLEGFGKALMPEGIPFGQLLFFMTVMPGIFEELAFRGVLLHGLRRRFHPAVVALVVGGVFGLFHVALFRLVPTAFLGVMLAAVTMLSGSIFPAMLWHALNNGIAILTSKAGIPLELLDPASYLAAAALLAVAFWVLWRNRMPYPGLRPWRRGRKGGA